MERTIDMDAIVDHITAAGHFAFVQQTGGGVATIYASSVARPEGGPLATVLGTDGEYRYEAIAGPGWFEGPGWTNPRAAFDDFYIGADDDGEGQYYVARDTDDERTIAARIVSTIESVQS